ncbi:hypothetical protein MHYP_G00174940 [Metynnis hypsauchen]
MVDPKTRSSDGGAAKQTKSLPPPTPTTRPGLLFKTSGTLNGKHDDVEKHSSCCFRHIAHLAEYVRQKALLEGTAIKPPSKWATAGL